MKLKKKINKPAIPPAITDSKGDLLFVELEEARLAACATGSKKEPKLKMELLKFIFFRFFSL